MPYLYKVVLGVTGAEGSSEEEVETLRSPPSPEELVVLLRVHVELPLGIAPGVLREEEHPAKLGGSTGPAQPEEPMAVTSSGTTAREILLFTLRIPKVEGARVLVAPCPPPAAHGQSRAGTAPAMRPLVLGTGRPVKYMIQN